jgi:hypothetical protein
MCIAIVAGKYCKEVGEDRWKKRHTVYTSGKMSECDTEARRFLQYPTGLAAARLARHQFADRVALGLFARPSRFALGNAPDLF